MCNLKPATACHHLAACIEQGDIKLGDVIEITDQNLTVIEKAILAMEDGLAKLKPVFDAPDRMYDYQVRRCVRASMTAVWPDEVKRKPARVATVTAEDAIK